VKELVQTKVPLGYFENARKTILLFQKIKKAPDFKVSTDFVTTQKGLKMPTTQKDKAVRKKYGTIVV
jgi:hypothetical protein